jgi:hypothetical protein
VYVRAHVDVAADLDASAAPQHAVRPDFDAVADANVSAGSVHRRRVQIRAMIHENALSGGNAIASAHDDAASEANVWKRFALRFVGDGEP